MSIFIALLSFPDQVTISSVTQFTVLTTFILSGLIGYITLKTVGKGEVFGAEDD
ncbi:hypothetical protein [Spirosoma agri]|uniref:hypothetical protein n=1 Tax=Spirosoma agri TaxID=1987381 RepID=UPI003742AF72